MVNDTTPEDLQPDADEAPTRPRRRRASAPKSAAEHASVNEQADDAAAEPAEASADTSPGAPDSHDKPKKAKGDKKRKDGKKKHAEPADEPDDEAAPAAPAATGPTTMLLFQAPPLPTPVIGGDGQVAPTSSGSTRRGSGTPRGGGAPSGTADLDANGPDDGGAGDADEGTGSSRRRTRRRSGDAPREGEDAPGTTVRVRQPRQAPAPITEPQRVKGSTRLEAKKQRRRDGRDAGRRRPVITEAEFLARRESVDRNMVVRSKYGRIQIGVLEDGVLVEHYVARAADASLIGNVYLGRVQNVLPSMEAAFVDIGRGRNAVLYSGEVDWEAAQAQADTDGRGQQARRIELALKPGDKVLVQVTKDPVGHKGARLTSQISLPGRYLVYVPNGSMNGISRKLPDTERARLKKILKEVLPDDAGVIVRTAAEGATEEQLTLDVSRLTNQWASISAALQNVQAPALLHSEPDLLIKIVRDVFNEDFQKLVVEGEDALETISSYVTAVAPDLADRLERYESDVDSFDEYRVSEQIEKALDRKVWLPSGGSLVIDRTEAMTVVDVNTGKFVGSGGNLEETVTKNNLEAAEEIVRQLRLRDIGGIIVVDFIDMVLETNRDLVLRRLVECLSRDRTKHQVAEVTSLGLVQMTRKKLGLGLVESFSENCEVCAGRGIIIHHEPVFKHRPQQSEQPSQNQSGGSSRSRRGRGGNGGGSAPISGPKNGHGPSGTHAITDDVRNALAQIAKSTVPHHDDAGAQAPEAPVSVSADSIVSTDVIVAAPEVVDAPSKVEEAAEAAAEAAVEILDIPLGSTGSSRSARRISTQDAEQILGSVLEALPEPTKPGQSRGRRSRRASSSGVVVTPAEGVE